MCSGQGRSLAGLSPASAPFTLLLPMPRILGSNLEDLDFAIDAADHELTRRDDPKCLGKPTQHGDACRNRPSFDRSEIAGAEPRSIAQLACRDRRVALLCVRSSAFS